MASIQGMQTDVKKRDHAVKRNHTIVDGLHLEFSVLI